MGILEKITEIEKEISRTQKNKGNVNFLLSEFEHNCVLKKIIISYLATEYHLGLLKAKLAKYRVQLLEPTKGAGAKVSTLIDRFIITILINFRLIKLNILGRRI
jgi:ribosome-interacting GTPase 1